MCLHYVVNAIVYMCKTMTEAFHQSYGWKNPILLTYSADAAPESNYIQSHCLPISLENVNASIFIGKESNYFSTCQTDEGNIVPDAGLGCSVHINDSTVTTTANILGENLQFRSSIDY